GGESSEVLNSSPVKNHESEEAGGPYRPWRRAALCAFARRALRWRRLSGAADWWAALTGRSGPSSGHGTGVASNAGATTGGAATTGGSAAAVTTGSGARSRLGGAGSVP